MRNTAEYEEYLTNPLEGREIEEPQVRCDLCGDPQDEQPWCGNCGCCQKHCAKFVGCPPGRYIHDCDDCIYQGVVGKYDAYYCPGEPGGPCMVYRWASDSKKEGYGLYLCRALKTVRYA